ncbi:MAG TPA: helix-turn-helix domain-containing protein [Longimicrobiales bacterium]|nr:helix-turn-helix domain-containing protein [Longimicrobiales bacterium]
MLPAHLREVIDRLPDSASLTLTVPELRDLLDHLEGRAGHTPPTAPYPDYSTGADVCARYGISAKTLERRRKDGTLPGALKKHNRWLYPAAAIRHYEQWLLDDAQRKRNEPPAEDPPDPGDHPPDLAALGAWHEEERTHGDR